ncbi:transcription initiation factor TFIID subunit 6 [Acrasis kona]|uniref:Transcription initiation factor TFIID subunit 6 n=1 Tax=Acrasis kona TaxID=1008807 RepID=A0AAW2YKP3_9EUKA
MSLQKESIQVIAQTLGISKLKDDAAQALTSDVEYRLREIIQNAAKFSKHSKRTILTTHDVNHALSQMNVEPLYGFSTGTLTSVTGKKNAQKRHRFRRVAHTTDLFFLEDPELDIKDCLKTAPPKLPIGPTVTTHWLAIQGVQPKIQQNPAPPTDKDVAGGDPSKNNLVSAGGVTATLPVDAAGATNGVELRPLVKHVLSAELQMYYEKVTEAIKGDKPLLRRACLDSMSSDPGLHQLVPYFTQFVAEEVTNNMRNLSLLMHLMEMTRALLTNPTLHVELYLHQLMPSILTCLVGKRLCENPNQDHWTLRDFCAGMIAHICKKYGPTYHTIQPRITKALLHAFLDPKRPRTTHYGAIVGITALGPHVSQLLFLEPSKNSNLRAYSRLLLPDMESRDAIVRHEALKCYGALLDAVSAFFVRLAPFFKKNNSASSLDGGVNMNGGIAAAGGRPTNGTGLASTSTGFGSIEENEQDEEEDEAEVANRKQTSNEEGKKATEELTKSLRERMNSLSVPDDVLERYQEMYDLFGESVLPFIFYDIVPNTNEQSTNMLAMNVFL